MRPWLIVAAALTAAAGAAAYMRFGRPRVINWGATPEEIERGMPGDDILLDATLQTSRAITIDARPEDIWPWLVQMGLKPRAGAYTYDWFERMLGIDIENSDRILPEYQHLEPGEFIGETRPGEGIVARVVKPQEFLVIQWEPAKSTWAFGLYAQGDGTTRLVSRNKLRGNGVGFWAGMIGFMEPGSLIMERKMLLGIKERAERLARREIPGEGGTSREVAVQLAHAVQAGDASAVRDLLSVDPKLACEYTADGWSMLHLAANAEVARILIEASADINARNRHVVFGPGNRPLHAAVYMDRPDVVHALIEAGAEVSSTDDAGWTPLHLAVANGRVEIARMLLAAGADPNARINPVEGRSWSHCTPLDLLEVQDATGEGAPPLPEDVQHELWELLRRYGARAPGAVVGSAPEHSPEQDQAT